MNGIQRPSKLVIKSHSFNKASKSNSSGFDQSTLRDMRNLRSGVKARMQRITQIFSLNSTDLSPGDEESLSSSVSDNSFEINPI